MDTSTNRGHESTQNTPLGVWALLKFAALLRVTVRFLLMVAKKAVGSVVMLIRGPPDVVPKPAPSPHPAPPQPRSRRAPVVQHRVTEEVQRIQAAAEDRALRILNGGRFRN
ncbi:unnamed protein product [Ectocarpus sp. CCAP 1310/34]|nr:unnamed protein product [Ectocarpus sp. CCAP 1310/34]